MHPRLSETAGEALVARLRHLLAQRAPTISQARADWIVQKLSLSNYHPKRDEALALIASQRSGAATLASGQVDLIEKIASHAIDPRRLGEIQYELGETTQGGETRNV